MKKIEEARKFLSDIGMPKPQQSDLCSLCLLSLANIKEDDKWKNAKNDWLRIHDIIGFVKEYYGISYAENSRETIRKQALHHFRNAALIEDNGVATNSPNYRYRLTEETISLLRVIGSSSYPNLKEKFSLLHENLINTYSSKRKILKNPVKINGNLYKLSVGKHNDLQKAVIEEFVPRFAPCSEVLYLGDTTEKELILNNEKLTELGLTITSHDKIPDVIVYRKDKDWIYFIECVTSTGPMSPKRILEINEMSKNVKSGLIFISAFLDFKTYKKFSDQIAWDTEVWIAEMSDHMIHLNGDKFLGPR